MALNLCARESPAPLPLDSVSISPFLAAAARLDRAFLAVTPSTAATKGSAAAEVALTAGLSFALFSEDSSSSSNA